MRRLQNNGSLVPDSYDSITSRGIEQLLSGQVFHDLCQEKTRVIRAILEEQHKQHQQIVAGMLKKSDPLRLAAVSSGLSADAVARSIAKGAADQAFVVAENTSN